MGRALSWVVVAGVAAIGMLAAADAFRSSPEPDVRDSSGARTIEERSLGSATPTVRSPDADLCNSATYGGQWTDCPQADWVRAVAEEAGYRMTDETGSALVAAGRGQSFYIWSTHLTVSRTVEVKRDHWKRAGRVAGVPIYHDGPWRWWVVDDLNLVLWLNAGPHEFAGLPTLAESAPLVRASLTVPASWAIRRCSAEQLALRAALLNGEPVIEVVQTRGGLCRTPRLPITIVFFDSEGNKVKASANTPEEFRPTDLSSADLIAGFSVIRRCGEPQPRRFVVNAGRYVAQAELPRGVAYPCLTDLGP
jgi:hypothetical protein